jgi:hypothetical protein
MTDKQKMLRSYEQREQLRYEYQRDQMKEVNIKANKRDIYGKEDMLNLPRHQIYTHCTDFVECPIDYKCRNFDSTYAKCRSCVLHETDGICKKKHIHTEKVFNMMISRERIDLDAKENA